MNSTVYPKVSDQKGSIRGRPLSDWACCVCESLSDSFMVHDEVWYLEAGLKRNQNTCVPCLEKLIRRPLVAADFQPAPPCNRAILWALKRGEEMANGK